MSVRILQGITWDHPRGYQPLVAASEEYLTAFGVDVHWERRSLKDFGDQPLSELAKAYDLLIMDHPHVGVAAESTCLVALDQYLSTGTLQLLQKQSAGPSFDSYHYAGHQWALPIDAAFQCASYRRDLLLDPPPRSWKEVFHLARIARKEGRFVGMALCPTDALCAFLSLSAQMGAAVLGPRESLIPPRIGEQVLEQLALMRDTFHPSCLDWNPIQLYDRMAASDEVVYCPLAFNYTNYSRAGFRRNWLQFTNAPGQIALLGGAGLAISANCHDIEGAVAYARWVCGADIQRTIYTTSEGQPGNGEAWRDEDCDARTHHFFSATRTTLEAAYVRPRFPSWPKYQEWLGEEIHRYLKKRVPVRGVINGLNEAYAQIHHEKYN